MDEESTDPEVCQLILANGALLEAPIFEAHVRGSNWLAIIDIDATCPGGLERRFTNRGKGDCLYVVEQIGLFDAVEFAADYTTSYGKKRRDRWYGVVTAKTDDFLQVEKADSGAKAVLRSKKLRTSPEALATALEQERETLIARAVKIDLEIAELRSPEEVPAEETNEARVEEPTI